MFEEVAGGIKRSSVLNQHLYRLLSSEIFYNDKAAIFKTGELD
jgi:hypothetical protein